MERLPDILMPLPVGMKDIRIIAVKEDTCSLTITVQKDLDFGLCPQCGTLSQKVNDHNTHRVTDRPIFKNQTHIEVLKRRWKCVNDFCEVKTFTEEIEGLPKKCTHTTLFYQDVYKLTRRMTYTGAHRHLEDAHCQIALSTIYQQAQKQLRAQVSIPATVETSYVGLDEFSKGKEQAEDRLYYPSKN